MLSFAAFRARRLQVVSRPLGIVAIGLCLPAILKAAILREWVEAGTLTTMCIGLSLPAVMATLGMHHLVVPAGVGGHMLGSSGLLAVALGWVPQAPVITDLIAHRRELISEVIMSVQCQVSLPWAALIHAWRFLCQYLVYTRCLGGGPGQGAVRFLLDWAVLMALQCCYEARSWDLYTRQKQHTDTGTQPSDTTAGKAHRTEYQASSKHTGTDQGTAAAVAASMRPTGKDACVRDPGTPALARAALSGVQQPMHGHSAESSGDTAGGQRQPPRSPAAHHNGAVVERSAPSDGEPPAASLSSRRLDSALRRMRRRPCCGLLYRRHPQYQEHTVFVKLHDLEAEDLPADLFTMLREQVHTRLPELVLRGATYRWGCVMITLDLLCPTLDNPQEQDGGEEQQDLALAQQCMVALGEVLRQRGQGAVMGTGDRLQVQAARQVVSGSWDPTAQQFQQTSDVALRTLTRWLSDHAAVCQLTHSQPAVHCAAPHLQLPLTLQLPGVCRLLGWPLQGSADVSGGAAVAGATIVLGCSESPAGGDTLLVPEVCVLVKQQGGGYLPVTLSVPGTPTLGVPLAATEAAAGAVSTLCVAAEASVRLDTVQPGRLDVELWVRVRAPETNLLVELIAAGEPVVLFPAHHQAVVAELRQHHELNRVGDGALLHDLATWAHHTYTGVKPSAQLAEELRDIECSVLEYAEGQGLSGLVGLVGPGAPLELEQTVSVGGAGQWEGGGAGGAGQATEVRSGGVVTDSVSGGGNGCGIPRTRVGSSMAVQSGSPATTTSTTTHGRPTPTAGCPISPAPNAGPPAPAVPPSSCSWGELWQWRPSGQFQCWAREQMSGIIRLWSLSLVLVGVTSFFKSWQAGSLRHEWGHMALNTGGYLLVWLTASGLGPPWLGSWQSWMPVLPWLHAAGYSVVGCLTREQAVMWATGCRLPVDLTFNVVMTAALDQNSLPYMLLSRVALAWGHSRAHAVVHTHHPWLRAALTQLLGVAVNLAMRCLQLRAYQKWRQNRGGAGAAKGKHA